MARTPEGKVKDRIKVILDEWGCWYDMPVPGGYGRSTLDFIVCCNGYMLLIEAKAQNGIMTSRQLATSAAAKKAGAKVLLINEVVGWSELTEFLAKCKLSPSLLE